MNCPQCNVPIGSGVKDSRKRHDAVYRKRACDACGHVFHTVETIRIEPGTKPPGFTFGKVCGNCRFYMFNQQDLSSKCSLFAYEVPVSGCWTCERWLLDLFERKESGE